MTNKTVTIDNLHEVYKDLEAGVEIIIDVRNPREFHEYHIPGTRNIPLDQIGEHFEELSKFKNV